MLRWRGHLKNVTTQAGQMMTRKEYETKRKKLMASNAPLEQREAAISKLDKAFNSKARVEDALVISDTTASIDK